MRHLEGLLRPFFDKYDGDQNGQLDIQEFWSVFHDLQEHVQMNVSNFTQILVGGPAQSLIVPEVSFVLSEHVFVEASVAVSESHVGAYVVN